MKVRALLRACSVKLFELIPYEAYRKIDTWLRMRFLNRNEKDLSFGYRLDDGNAKLKYVVCRYAHPEMSTFAAAIQYLFAYDFITHKRLVPVADLDYRNCLKEGSIGVSDAWECTFKQDVSLEQVKKEQGVYVDTINSPHAWRLNMCRELNGDIDDHWVHASVPDWRSYFSKVHKYAERAWVFQDAVLEMCRAQFEDLRKEGEAVIGVSLREDFARSSYELRTEEEQVNFIGHPYVPEVEDTIRLIREKMEEWNCSRLFVSTERWESACLFRQIFGEEHVILISRPLITKDKCVVWQGGCPDNRNYYAAVALRDRFVPYSAEVLALSKCDYFIAAKSSGAIAALILNGGKYRDIWIEPDENEIRRY